MRCLIPFSAVATAALFPASAAFAATPQNPLVEFQGYPDSKDLGRAVASAGDIDGDGTLDYVVGDRDHVGSLGVALGGQVQVFSGIQGGSGVHVRFGTNVGDRLGFAVAGVGDLNGDGLDDYAAGAPQDRCACPLNGYVTVWLGSDFATGSGTPWLNLVLPPPAGNTARFGTSLAAVGDVDRDGVPDLAVGAPNAKIPWGTYRTGAAYVFSGATGAMLLDVYGNGDLDAFGSAVGSAGDADGDGTPDFVVGAPQTGLATGGGYARIFSGSTGALWRHFASATAGDEFGASVSGGGDLDSDGNPDVLLGAPGSDLGGADIGSVLAGSGWDGHTLRTIPGAAVGERFGEVVALLPDCDLDSVADLAVGVPKATSWGLPGAGLVRVFTGWSGSLRYEILPSDWPPPAAGDEFGAAIAPAGDFDHDGLQDLVVGNPYGAFPTPGRPVIVYSLLPRGTAQFGAGTPGCNATHLVAATTVPNLGNGQFGLRCAGTPSNTLGLLLITDSFFDPGVDPLGLGIQMHIDLFAAQFFVADAFANPVHLGEASAPIPNDPLFAGQSYAAQFFWYWPPTCSPTVSGLSSSKALSIVVQS